MSNLNEFQKKFFQAMAKIQRDCVGEALCKKNIPIEQLLYDISGNVIIEIMTLIDGYGVIDSKMDIINTENNQSMKTDPFIELHDAVCDYIK